MVGLIISHPFEDKVFAFIGDPVRCSRREAYEALAAVGGILDDRISTFTEYVVEFKHNGKTKKYAKALSDNKKGYLLLLSESQFFDIIEGKAEPPPKRNFRGEDVYQLQPLKKYEEYTKQQEKEWKDLLNYKRMSNMARYGVTMPDGSVAKIDLRSLDLTRRLLEIMKKQPDKYGFVIPNATYEYCSVCGKAAKVHIRADVDSDYLKFCQDCYNEMMAEFTGIKIPEFIPEQCMFKDNSGKSHKFDIDFLIFATGIELTAKEKGKYKRRIQVHGELTADISQMLQLLKQKIIKAINTKHIDERGYINNGIAEGNIEYNSKRDDYDIIIDGKPYTWEGLKKNISSHEGWNIKIEFGAIDDVLE